jgi:RES domain-containing protein
VSIRAWRVVTTKYSESPFNPFDGEGASSIGGRWNSIGVPVVYTSAAVSLAVLERLVHSAGKLSSLLDCAMLEVEIPDELVWALPPADLPAEWNDKSAVPQLRRLGDDWVHSAKSVALRIPSAVVTSEFNFVLNPRHPEFGRLVIGPRRVLPIDPRLLGS